MYFSGLSRLSYKLLFVRHDPSSITLGGKPSHGRSCHLEADPFSRATDSVLSLIPSAPPGVSLFLDLSFYHANPRRTPLRLDQTGPARLPWFSINFCNGAPHLCLACLSAFKTQIADARGCWIHKRHKNWVRSQFTCMVESRPGAAGFPRLTRSHLVVFARYKKEMMQKCCLSVLSFTTWKSPNGLLYV